MTTYPLSEPATILPLERGEDTTPESIGRGTLEDCAAIVAELPDDERRSVVIQMDDIDLRFSPEDIDSLLRYLEGEKPGLTEHDIATIKS